MRWGCLRLAICIALLAVFLIAHIERQNELTRLRLEIPQINASGRRLKESAMQLQNRVIRSQSPERLLALLDQPEFQHLHFPSSPDIWIIEKKLESTDHQLIPQGT